MASSETNVQSAREMQTAVVPIVGNIYLYENYSGSRRLRIGTFCEVVWVSADGTSADLKEVSPKEGQQSRTIRVGNFHELFRDKLPLRPDEKAALSEDPLRFIKAQKQAIKRKRQISAFTAASTARKPQGEARLVSSEGYPPPHPPLTLPWATC